MHAPWPETKGLGLPHCMLWFCVQIVLPNTPNKVMHRVTPNRIPFESLTYSG